MARDSPDALRAAHKTLLAVLCGLAVLAVLSAAARLARTAALSFVSGSTTDQTLLVKLSWRCCAVTRLARNAAMRLRVMRNAHWRTASVSQSQDDFFIVYRQ